MSQANKYKIKNELNFNMLLLILIPMILIGGAVAKYIQEKDTEIVYQAKSFYFESNILSDNTNPRSYTYEIGNNNISFELKNNIDDLRYSEVDIEFVAMITDVQGNQVKDKEGEIIAEQTGKLLKNAINSQKIEFSNLPSGTYKVTAKAMKPYEKTLQATFLITEKNENIEYQVSDALNSPVLQLTVKTKDYSGNIKISWTEGIAPDTTNAKLSEVNVGYDGGSITVAFESNSEYNFQFFKKQTSLIYNKDDFSLERSE